jgi:hypothetical protein
MPVKTFSCKRMRAGGHTRKRVCELKNRRYPITKLDRPSRRVPGAAFPLSYESQYTPFPDVPGLTRAPSCALFICIHVNVKLRYIGGNRSVSLKTFVVFHLKIAHLEERKTTKV